MSGLLSWGRHPAIPQRALPLAWRDQATGLLARHAADGATTLGYGGGRSYGDSCLAVSDTVVAMRGLDRIVAADWTTGLLTAEAGVTLAEILALAVPHGWFLPVTPGTGFATLGGAIANDVHGKNHHVRGTFGRHVRAFALARSDGAVRQCTPGQEPALFAATIGGLGLTGLVLEATVQLVPIRSSRIDTLTIRFGNLDEFFALSAELDPQHEYTVSWIDCLARGRAAGRGVFTAGDHAPDGPLEPARPSRLAVPFAPPWSPVRNVSVRAFNALYFRRHRAGRRRARVDHRPFFHPLDAIGSWNRLYGRAGFQQFQCVVPTAAARDAVGTLLDTVAASGHGSFLAVLKRCGDLPSPGWLSFPMPGVSLALDFPQSAALESTLLPRLDAIVREAGGRLYPAKDAHMTADDFQRAYPDWPRVQALRDPALASRFWQRVTGGAA